MFIRDSLKDEFDDFFNHLLSSIHRDWNLFSVQETLLKETKKFNDVVAQSLEKISASKKLIDFDESKNMGEELKRFYEQLSETQQTMSSYKEDWSEYEQSISQLISCLGSHSEFEIIDGNQLKSFLSESFVLNYSNIELNRFLLSNKNGQSEGKQPKIEKLRNSSMRMDVPESNNNSSLFSAVEERQVPRLRVDRQRSRSRS